MTERHYDLGIAELEVLGVLWEHGPCTVRQALEHLRAVGRQLAYTTVLTFLTRMEQKGVVTSDKSTIAYVYRPTVSRERIRKTRLKSLLSQLYDGAAGPLVLQLLKTEKLSAEEIVQLRKLLKELDGGNK